jgi:phytanoyl-CoA hydroxylase
MAEENPQYSLRAKVRLGVLRRQLEHERLASECSTVKSSNTSFKSQIQFSRDVGVLTEDQRAFYEENGFLVIPRLVQQNDLDVYRSRFLELCTNKSERNPSMTVMRDVALKDVPKVGENTITKVQDFQDDPVLFSFSQHPEYVFTLITIPVF